MTQEELRSYISPIIKVLDSIQLGQPVPSVWQVPDGYTLEKRKIGEAQVEHLIPDKNNGKVVFHLHGGGYIFPLVDVYRDIGVQYSQLVGGAEVYSVDYRVAPNFYAHAALEDAVATYEYILKKGHKPKDILFIGDSAGGNLVLVTVFYLKKHKMPLPKGVIGISPWAGMENTFESRKENEDKDLVIGKSASNMYHEVMNPSYFKNCDLKDPFVSPIYGDYKGFPSLLLQVGSYEILRDDCILVAKAAKEAGVDVTQTTYPEMSHDFQLFFQGIEETKQAWIEMKTFVNRVLELK